jgi:hypothetical protein
MFSCKNNEMRSHFRNTASHLSMQDAKLLRRNERSRILKARVAKPKRNL